MEELRKAGRVSRLRGKEWSEAEKKVLAVLAALAEPTRLAAVRLVWASDEMCLCEIMNSLGIMQSRASRHMAVLVKAGILLDRRDAQWVRYRKNTKLAAPLVALVKSVMANLPVIKVSTKKGLSHEKH